MLFRSFLYPVLYRSGILDGLNDRQVAVYLGSTLHEVAHVVGAGNAMDAAGGNVADAATVTKMIRVMMLAPVLVVMSLVLSRRSRKASMASGHGFAEGAGVCAGNEEADGRQSGRGKIAVPWFAVLFLVAIGINSMLQSMPLIPSGILNSGLDAINAFDTFLLTMAMTALGAETSFDKFRQAGAKPFLLAGILYIWLIFGGYAIASLL